MSSRLSDEIIDETTEYEIKVERFIMSNVWHNFTECMKEVLLNVKHPNPNVPIDEVVEFIEETYREKQSKYHA
tara:strand:- start:171 stop:389 length:219 start_codon:yes stop_codon:yes gene_type:complete